MNFFPTTDSLSTVSTAAEGAKHTFFDASLASDTGHLQISISPWVWGIVVLFLMILLIRWISLNRQRLSTWRIRPSKATFKVAGLGIDYTITRNFQNQEIAYRIYTELKTRKAALPFEEDKDVIEEVYNSWYKLFEVTREELKSLSGESLSNHKHVSDLIDLLTAVLNDGLRTHLTEYQAEFRKWYEEEVAKEDNKGKSPQEIQRGYEKYNELVADMKEVNETLMDYAKQLREEVLEWPPEKEKANDATDKG